MTNKKLATEFVKKYPLMFNEDQDFWIDEIEKLLDQAVDLCKQKIVDDITDELYKKYEGVDFNV